MPANAAPVVINERRLSEMLSTVVSDVVFGEAAMLLFFVDTNGVKRYFIALLVQEDVQLKHVTQRDTSTFILAASIASALHVRSHVLQLLHALLSIEMRKIEKREKILNNAPTGHMELQNNRPRK